MIPHFWLCHSLAILVPVSNLSLCTTICIYLLFHQIIFLLNCRWKEVQSFHLFFIWEYCVSEVQILFSVLFKWHNLVASYLFKSPATSRHIKSMGCLHQTWIILLYTIFMKKKNTLFHGPPLKHKGNKKTYRVMKEIQLNASTC